VPARAHSSCTLKAGGDGWGWVGRQTVEDYGRLDGVPEDAELSKLVAARLLLFKVALCVRVRACVCGARARVRMFGGAPPAL
jgi:hypothetical protein